MGKQASLWKKYVLKDGKLEARASFCPVCGRGYVLAEHAERYTCGKCGYTSFKKK